MLVVAYFTLFAPLFVVAQAVNFAWLYTLIGEVARLISVTVPVLIALALALFLWGLVVFIFQADSDQARAAGRARMVWGVIILFVAVSVWGLVALMNQLSGVQQGVTVVAPQAVF